MLAVHNAGAAAEWYKRALGAEELWDFGGVVGLTVERRSVFLGEPANKGWNLPPTSEPGRRGLSSSSMTPTASSNAPLPRVRKAVLTTSATTRQHGAFTGRAASPTRSVTSGLSETSPRCSRSGVRNRSCLADVMSRLDRLSRSVHDLAILLKRARAEGWNVVLIDYALDLSTPYGEFGTTMLRSRPDPAPQNSLRMKPVDHLSGTSNTGACRRPVCPRHDLGVADGHPDNDRYTRCRDSVNEAIHCAPSFLINLE